MDDALGQSIFAGVSDGSDRDIYLNFGKTLGIIDRQTLRSAARVVNQSLFIRCFSLPDCLPQCVEDKLCPQRCRGAPPHDPPRKDINQESGLREAAMRLILARCADIIGMFSFALHSSASGRPFGQGTAGNINRGEKVPMTQLHSVKC
jgi:hypothetical protein